MCKDIQCPVMLLIFTIQSNLSILYFFVNNLYIYGRSYVIVTNWLAQATIKLDTSVKTSYILF